MSNIGTKFILAQTYIFDPNSNSLTSTTNSDEIVRLGSNESRILLMLCDRPNSVVTRDELHEFVWRDQGFQVDDSSLTQAISTLRKMLKDSTKTPQFVKTVPKRGYQLISSVEKSNPSSAKAEEINLNLAEVNASSDLKELETPRSEAQPKAVNKPSFWQKTDMVSRVLFGLAILLPILAILSPNSAPSQFRQVTTVNELPVLTTEGHPDLTNWIPQIEICVSFYMEKFSSDSVPIEIYATTGQNGQLYLNYIHPAPFSNENSTVRLVADQSDLNKICK